MTKVDIFSGFLGAGKTTLIKKLVKEAYTGEMIVIIENEFGKVGIDSGFLKESGIQITEMNSGCICCSLVGDFGEALKKVKEDYNPDRIVIEPSGVGKLSDVILAVRNTGIEDMTLNTFTTVIDASKCKMYMKNFAEFYTNQIEFASTVVFSRTKDLKNEKIEEAISIVRSLNTTATVITTPWDELDGKFILDSMENKNTLDDEIKKLLEEEKHKESEHHHHHHHDEEECDDPDCECHHHDDHDEHHHGHHHHHDEDECDDPDCECHHHDGHHHHHHDHDADDVFTSWGIETADKYSVDFIEDCLDELVTGKYGMILRAKGIVAKDGDKWIHFDYVPGEKEIREGTPDVIGKLCVIGSNIDKEGLTKLFGNHSD